MNKHCVVVADGARARIFSYEPGRPSPRGDCLFERETLVNPEHQEPEHELFSERRRGARGHVPGHWYIVDDHRGEQDVVHERRFAARVVEASVKAATALEAKSLVIVAPPRMLGFVRELEPKESARAFPIHELARELSKVTPYELQAQLEAEELLPKRPETRAGR